MNLTFKTSDKLPNEAKEIRTTVFVCEQGFKDEFDESDDISIHILMYLDLTPIGVARIIYQEKHACYTIGRFAILKEYRNKGYGRELLKYVEQVIVDRFGHILVGVSAQERAKEFYLKMGYVFTGEKYLDENYPHYYLTKKL